MQSTLFCLDFDETLMSTDRLRADILEAIRTLGQEELATIYQTAYETTRRDHGVPRMPLVLKTMAEQGSLPFETHQKLAALFHDFPYQNYIYPGAEDTIKQLRSLGKVVILSDGDQFFQPDKIRSTSLAGLVDGVVVLPSKVEYFDDIIGYYPAEHYVFIDDKQKVIDAAKAYFGERATTVLVQQGRYANLDEPITADKSVKSIADVAQLFAAEQT